MAGAETRTPRDRAFQMQSPRLTLSWIDEQRRPRQVRVQSARFTIGSAPDNDLVIDGFGLARRHALIECFDGLVQISHCGSTSETLVNGRPIAGVTSLTDRDLILLGNAGEIEVHLISAPEPGAISQSESFNVETSVGSNPAAVRHGSREAIDRRVIVSLAAVFVIVFALLVLFNKQKSQMASPASSSTDPESKSVSPTSLVTEKNGASASEDPVRRINKLAMDVMRRISREDKQYDFSDAVLAEISERVRRHSQSPALEAALTAFRQKGRALQAEIQQERAMEPSLVFYTALAEIVSGQTGRDAMSTAQSVLQDLRQVRKDYGTDTPDSCLIVVAVRKMKSRSSAGIPASAVKGDAFRDRSVWYLHDNGKIDNDAYEFVLNFVAVGVIAQTPRQFGVASDPLPF